MFCFSEIVLFQFYFRCNHRFRSHRHTLQLPEHTTSLLDSNFLIRMLYKDSY